MRRIITIFSVQRKYIVKFSSATEQNMFFGWRNIVLDYPVEDEIALQQWTKLMDMTANWKEKVIYWLMDN